MRGDEDDVHLTEAGRAPARMGLDDLECAVLAAGVGGAEPLLERDRAALARGAARLRDGRERSAAFTLARAARTTSMFAGSEEAVARLLEAADAAGIVREQALRAAL